MNQQKHPPGQTPLPIQPVDKPILCTPYEEPNEHGRGPVHS